MIMQYLDPLRATELAKNLVRADQYQKPTGPSPERQSVYRAP